MNDPVLLQKSIRDNNEDILNFVKGMKQWEDDMKRKDKEITQSPEKILPPVRTKIKRQRKSDEKREMSKTENKKVETCNKSKSISSFDYSRWDKFDVEKACEEIDNPDEENDEDEYLIDERTEEEILHEKATYEKELGNAHVKKGNWKEAINSYSRAIKCFDKDAIFYANRALCYLKTNQLKAAEDDCTYSLLLDPKYVKAYQRRAAARTELKKYEDAWTDLNMVLKLEPNNLQAKKDLETLPWKKPTESKTSLSSSSQVSACELDVAVGKKSSDSEVKTTIRDIPPWSEVDPSRIVHPIKKPPHLRSKKPLKRIDITDVDDNHLSGKKYDSMAEHLNKSVITARIDSVKLASTVPARETKLQTAILPENTKCVHDNRTQSVKSALSVDVTKNNCTNDIPLPPKNSVQFHLAWRKLKDNLEQLYLYLKQIDGHDLPSIFQDSLESIVFSGIISVLSSEFVKHSTPVADFLEGLSSVRRFGALVLFMSKQDKEGVKKIVDYCSARQEITEEKAATFRKKFEL